MKEYKIDLSMHEGKVRELVSEVVQKKAFELGYEWFSGKEILTNSPYFFFNEDCHITYAETGEYFERHKGTLISAADFLALTPEDVQGKPKDPELKPFDHVLVRDSDDGVWIAHFYSHREEYLTYELIERGYTLDYSHREEYLTFSHRAIGGEEFKQCIPYEGNEHLLGTTEDVK